MNHTPHPSNTPECTLPTEGCGIDSPFQSRAKVCHPALGRLALGRLALGQLALGRLALGLALTLGQLALMGHGAMAADGASSLSLAAGAAVVDETGALSLDMITTRVAVAPVWASEPIAKPNLPAGFGVGQLFIYTTAGMVKISVTASMSAYDIAAAINARRGRVRAAVVNNGVHHRLMIASESGNNPAAFDDTGTLHIPNGINAFDDTGTLHIPGGFVATAIGQTIASAPFQSSIRSALFGSGTLWLTMGEDTLAVDVTTSMSLINVRDAINAEGAAFNARIVKSAAGHSLVIDAVSAEMTDLLAFEDTGTLHVPGGFFSFDDTGTLHAEAGLFSFDDTGTLHTNGGGVAFEDTGTLHVPGGFFSFDDTGTLHIPRSTFSIQSNGALHIDLGVKLNNM